jgi:hypothetical protein
VFGVNPSVANAAQPNHLVCGDEKSYRISSSTFNNLVQTIPTVQLINHSASTATLSTTVTITGSVSASLSVTAGVDYNFIVATVKGSVTTSATGTISGAWATSASIPVRPGKVGYIEGGIFRVKTIGTYQHVDIICRVFTTPETAYTPYHFGYIATGG